MNWTAEQARAIELREKNILVAAAAGSGKTAVLVERIKKLILEGECSIDRMLIVTFTNAAAAEMKEKIERAIEKEAEENPGQVRLLKQQLERLPLANISTFHAFALEVIRRFFYLINVDPNFKICDNVQQELLKEQALDELLKEYFDAESPEFLSFLNKYSGDRNELKFRQTVRKTFEVIQSLPEPFPWLSAAAGNLDSDFETFASGKIPQFIMEDASLRFEEALGSILRFAEEAERLAHEGAAEITAAYVNIASELRDAARSGDFEALRALLSSVKMPSLLKKYFKPDDSHPQAELEEFKEKLEAARVPLKDAVTSLKKDFFYDSLASLHAEIRETFPDAAFFLKVMEDYRDIFAGLKKKRGVVDFSDIEHFAFEILKDEEAASYYREKFAYIFIDEYQDSNLLQEALIARIKRENNLFMVGDVKQSIYKFRLAEPEIFQARYRDFADEQNRAEAEGVQAVSEKIDLNKNFRSKESVIRFINRVFDAAMPGYDENAALHLGDPFGHNCNFEPKLFLAETPWDEDSELDDELKTMIKAEKEALHRSIERMGWVKNREFFPYHMESRAAYDGAGEESHRIIAAVMPHGDKDKWMEMAATLRTMQAARVMLATSFASVLLQPLQQRPFIFHLWANSRSGKTAVLKAAVSIYGDPNVLLRSYNSTAVGIEHTAGTVRNIPLALDELQSLSLKYENLSRMMYMLGNGIGKMRGDRIGGTQKMQTWCNTILSTGEQPITVQNSMDGENTRVMELYALPIGDTDFSRTVHQTAAENYGFAGQMFMDYLFHEYELEKGTSKLRQAYTNFRDEFVSMYAMLYEKCTSIHLEFVAVLVFADFIASKAVFNAGEEACGAAWEMGFELLEALKKEQKADAVERAWDTVKEWIASNQEHFEVKHLNEVAREPRLGRYEPGEKKTYILPNCLRKMLIDNGFSYEKSIRGFKDRGYVENRQENQRVGKSSVKVIIANIEQAYEYRKASEFF